MILIFENRKPQVVHLPAWRQHGLLLPAMLCLTGCSTMVMSAQVTQTGGPIEYLLVTGKGKLHESLFSCTSSPTDFNVAFKLLGYPASSEWFEIVPPDHYPAGKYPEVSEKTKSGARLTISASWQDEGSEKTYTLNDLVKNTATGEVIPPGHWLCTGSLITKTRFEAEAEATGGSRAVVSSSLAMVDFPSEARANDGFLSMSEGQLPATGTPVRIPI